MASNISSTSTVAVGGVDVEVFRADARGAVINLKLLSTTGGDNIVSVKIANDNDIAFTPNGRQTAYIERNVTLYASPNNVLMRGAIALPPNAAILVSSDGGVDAIISGVSGEV